LGNWHNGKLILYFSAVFNKPHFAMATTFFATQAQFRAWLEKHHKK
jgi:hypothetical protein